MTEWETDWSFDVLESIVALLFALAGLADLAVRLPEQRHRRQVLAILSHGEAEARAFVLGEAAKAPPCREAPESSGDAARLAVRFRALAAALCIMLAWRSALSVVDSLRPCGRSRRACEAASRWLKAPAATDTS